MSGVYISGMEMPPTCRKCRCCKRYDRGIYCALTATLIIGDENTKLDNCPLIPVPPHYDLIDHNALKIAVMDCDAETRIDFLKHAMDCINKAPVVIPSDMPTYEAEEEAGG